MRETLRIRTIYKTKLIDRPQTCNFSKVDHDARKRWQEQARRISERHKGSQVFYDQLSADGKLKRRIRYQEGEARYDSKEHTIEKIAHRVRAGTFTGR